ncbi:type II toxin-antitoxin system RelE/ParE family toxin [Psychrosphaera sp. B3R10]
MQKCIQNCPTSYASGSTVGIQKKHEKKLRLILANLDQAEEPDDMDLPGLFMHQLIGDRKDIWSVRVSGNWRITYMFILTIEDYQRVSWSIRFDSVDFNFVNDPVYISDAKFSELNGLNIAEFSDDDGLIIKIIYGNCAAVCL